MASMLSQLQWPTLHILRQISILYQGLHYLISLEIPTYITTTITTTTPTRFQHPFHFNIPIARTNHYHNSYFLKTFHDYYYYYNCKTFQVSIKTIQGYKKKSNTNNQVSRSLKSLIEVAFTVSSGNLFHCLIVVGK